MRLVKSILLGSAAGFTAVAGAQAADLPVKKAVPVEYVRVCTAYGVGFFYIPGTDTCLRISGRARGEYHFTSTRSYGNTGVGPLVAGDISGFRGLGRVQTDARTQTAYGTLRTFFRLDLGYTGGGYITSGTTQRFAFAYPALGQDTFGRAQTQVFLDKAFVQFAGITAGRASSFFDFYAHDIEMIGVSTTSDVPSTNLFAYTTTWGNTGFSSTISIEDPVQRRQPVFATGTIGGTVAAGTLGGTAANFVNFGATFISAVPVAFDPITGLPTAFTNVDVVQRERVPDIVSAYRWEGSWGAVQFSTATHEISLGKYQNGIFNAVPGAAGAAIPGFAPFVFPGAAANGLIGGIGTLPVAGGVGAAPAAALNGAAGNFFPVKEPEARYGWAAQAGIKVNLPMIAPGDVFYLQAAYAKGAMSYAGVPRAHGIEALNVPISGKFVVNTDDAVVFANGKVKLTDAESITAAFLHYWTPQWRQAIFGSYANVQFPRGSRGPLGPLANLQGVVPVPGAISGPVALVGTNAIQNALAFNSTLRDYDHAVIGSNLIYSPVKDLDIGLEVLYSRITLRNGSVADGNKVNVNGAGGAVAANATGGIITGNVAGLAPGVPLRITNFDDVVIGRFRIQRDF